MIRRDVLRRLRYALTHGDTETARLGMGLVAILYGIAMLGPNVATGPNYVTALWIMPGYAWCMALVTHGVMRLSHTLRGSMWPASIVVNAWFGAALWVALAGGRVHDASGPDAVLVVTAMAIWLATRMSLGRP